MLKFARPLRRMCVIAGVVVAAAFAQGMPVDGQIVIDKALNSPTLTVRYSSANAAVVELRINGESVATRSMSASRSSGETTFDINLASLKGGDNDIEIRLFDKAGKLLGSEKSLITAEQKDGPVFLTNPKMGSTLQGNVEIKVGFGQTMKNSYVSFFIDNQFKSISNVAPFSFFWDTSRDSNGWHEVEAWVVDENSTTFKTRKVRIFVNNPGGQTARQGLTTATTVSAPVAKPAAKPPVKPTAKPIAAPVKPATNVASGVALSNTVKLAMGASTSSKPASVQASVATGLQVMTPTGTRLANSTAVALVAKPAAAPAGKISISKGQRLPNIGSFAIVYNTQFVNFDVQPRVTNGVPLTPFRHLIEKAGGKVEWENSKKNVNAQADGKDIFLHIGDRLAMINKLSIELEQAPFLESGRTIVPLSFMRDALNVNIDYDKATGHVLITNAKK